MAGIVDDEAELERVPSPSDLGEEHTVRPVPWRARLRSVVVGTVLVVFLGSVLAALSRIGGPGWTMAVGAAVLSGGLCVAVLRRGGDVDPRWLAVPLSVSILAAGLLAPSPRPLPAVLAGLAVLILVTTGLAVFQRRLTRTRSLVLAWNEAFARLAESPRRAVSCTLDVETVEHPRGRRVEGEVAYVAADGTRRTASLVSPPLVGLDLPAGRGVHARSPAVVWHTDDHTVVLTRVLATGV